MLATHQRSVSVMRYGLAVVLAAGLVAAFWWQGERFIAANGPTFDEAAHLAAGYSYWTTGSFRMNREDPPLLKLWWALPLVLGERPPFPHDVAAATGHDHWHVGTVLVYGSGVPPSAMLTPARRMNLAVGCGVVLVAGWWAFRAWKSPLAGLAASAFAAFDPNLLALSCVLSTDVGLTFFALLTSYLLWEYSAAASRQLLIAAGVSLGLMVGSKLSALGVVAGLGVAGGLFVLRGGVLALPGATPPGGWTTRSRLRATLDLAFRLGVIGLVTLAATYGFIHFDEWGRGLKFQLTRAGHGDGHFYLCGDLSRTGWYHYFLVALAVKLPLGLLAASLVPGVSLLALLGRPDGSTKPSRLPVWFVVPPLVFLAAASYSRVDLGIRVVLPAVAFLYVVAAGLAAPGCGRAVRLILLGGCVAWAGVSGWIAAPHQIAYFNELSGGPAGGVRVVADSNADWGQDLPQLKAYMDREGIGAVYLSYFGTDRPEAYGIRFQPLPGYGRVGPPGGELTPVDAPRHVVAVSANNLLGIYIADPDTFAWLRTRPPTAILGGSIYLFDLTADPDAIRRLRAVPANPGR
ncbi:MAG: Dolichyl-phosphate-mannose-protein mannosyltransferase [Gemmataceae bacterium]|nr:Dolichyl-phosphate-mannose-protein mannosyltransferase [Gemmataceae bacterium]